jgi:hypothetical protein
MLGRNRPTASGPHGVDQATRPQQAKQMAQPGEENDQGGPCARAQRSIGVVTTRSAPAVTRRPTVAL